MSKSREFTANNALTLSSPKGIWVQLVTSVLEKCKLDIRETPVLAAPQSAHALSIQSVGGMRVTRLT